MLTTDNKALVQKWVDEVLNSGNVADNSAAEQLVSADFVGHLAGFPPVHGLDAFRQLGAVYYSAFPDLHLTIEELIAEGDRVAMRYTNHATHKGELMDIPATGRQVTASGISIYRIAGGKIAEQWDNYDNLGVLQQLGVIPAMG